MFSSAIRAVAAAALVLAGIGPAHANDGDRILRAIIGTGVGTILNEMQQRDRKQPQTRQQRQASPRSNPATSGLSSGQVKAAQSRLNDMGYDAGAPDGQAGSRTRQAIRQYQADWGWPATGVLTGQQYRALVANATGQRQQQQAAEEGALSRGETAELQRALASLGFEVGTIDGVVGSTTGRAISGFLTRRGLDPYQTSIHEARELILATAAGEASPAQATRAMARPASMRSAHLSPDMIIDWSPGHGAGSEHGENLGRALVRRIVHANPQILENQEVLKSWLSDLAYGVWPDPKILSLHETFSKGTEFERPGALREFRAFLQEHATGEPLTIVRVRRTVVNAYDFNEGAFPLRLEESSSDFAKEMSIDWRGRPSVWAIASSWRSIDRLPMPQADAEALAKTLGSHRVVDVAMRMTLSNFHDRSGGVAADASIEDVSVHFAARSDTRDLGEFIANLPFDPIDADPLETMAAASSALESWRRLGAPVDGDAVYLRTYNDDDKKSMWSPLDLLGLKQVSKPVESLQIAGFFTRTYTDRNQFGSLFGDATREFRGTAMRYNKFLGEGILEAFNRDYLPSLVSRAPQLPVKLRIHWQPFLELYDVQTASLPITHTISNSFRNGGIALDVLPNVPVQTNLSHLPFSVPMEEPRAEALRERTRDRRWSFSERGIVHAVMDLRLDRMTSSQKREDWWGLQGLISFDRGERGLTSRVHAEVLRIALYEDAALTRLIVEFPLEELLYQPAEPEAPLGEPLPEGLNLSRWNIWALAAKLGAGDKLIEEAIRASESYRKVDAVTRPLQLERMKAMASSAFPNTGQDLYLPGSMSFAGYDPALGLPVSGYSFSVMLDTDQSQIDEGLAQIVVQNEKDLRVLSVDHATVDALTRDRQRGEFSALFRVRPVSAARVPGSEKPLASVNLAVESIVILHPDVEDRVLVEIPVAARADMSDAGDSRSPQSRFTVLGVKLGMPIAEAREILASHIAASPATPLTEAQRNYGARSPCYFVTLDAKREGATEEETEERLRRDGCPILEEEPIVFALGYDLQLSDDLTERLIVYRTGDRLGEPVVSGIYRKFSPETVGTMLEINLPKQYGDDFIVPDNAANQRIWVDNPSQRPLFQQNTDERCVPFWMGDDGFPSRSLLHDCGAFLRAESYRLVLMDSGFATRIAREQRENTAVAKEKAKPEIRF